ncbi:hypothetical protein HDU67_007082 [Dinochytrium kinnereticum]|nr:hypothetical protein HDU67_007082 [Dinochytrium kinnereticum]
MLTTTTTTCSSATAIAAAAAAAAAAGARRAVIASAAASFSSSSSPSSPGTNPAAADPATASPATPLNHHLRSTSPIVLRNASIISPSSPPCHLRSRNHPTSQASCRCCYSTTSAASPATSAAERQTSGGAVASKKHAHRKPQEGLFRLHQQRLHQQRLSAASASTSTSSSSSSAASSAHVASVVGGSSAFYNNRILERYAARETKRVTLRQLTVFGRNLSEEKLIRSGNYVREELPVRLAHRIRDFQHLPFIVGTNPHIEELYALYWDAFERFRSFREIRSLEDNREFCELVDSMLNTHLVAIPKLALGIAEAAPHMSMGMADRFFNEMLRSRIGRRVLAEQHITLSAVFDGREAQEDGWIGIVNTRCRADDVVERCANLASRLFSQSLTPTSSDSVYTEPPQVTVDGHISALFTYIPDHIEYILFEILRNSMRFTHEAHGAGSASPNILIEEGPDGVKRRVTKLPPIRVTIGASETAITFRVSDQGGGIPRDVLENLWSYSQAALAHHQKSPSTPNPSSTKSPTSTFPLHLPSTAPPRNLEKMPRLLAGKIEESGPEELNLGLGLPMSRVYANYWGGAIAVHSMHGYGTDAYVRIATGNQMENLTYGAGGSGGPGIGSVGRGLVGEGIGGTLVDGGH